ncbi:hypothetical protein PUN28_008181 [Cardiocondyla obscurior]|uniref:Uncharacterized protein n=1 Tax=Cardiocondyla obscurior TaxID=286306 RepID=A0AAW2FY36_9HYME
MRGSGYKEGPKIPALQFLFDTLNSNLVTKNQRLRGRRRRRRCTSKKSATKSSTRRKKSKPTTTRKTKKKKKTRTKDENALASERNATCQIYFLKFLERRKIYRVV